jgi:hypothetical protein
VSPSFSLYLRFSSVTPCGYFEASLPDFLGRRLHLFQVCSLSLSYLSKLASSHLCSIRHRNFSAAISSLNQAIQLLPFTPTLYLSRAGIIPR